MPVNCELEPEALEQQIAVAKVKVINQLKFEIIYCQIIEHKRKFIKG